ncbi:heterokaryon incompatibility protein [Colletotrichum zoysiae]|uniref:Heterokaryon incompatibility protein n=1 Tax=Colletotrichum zoysiae TaxID=1216348 RepID=A0AAD9H7N7_9PEZI|nr:heterokaryon incompatibility protein [Colletotrichum zoysiae]
MYYTFVILLPPLSTAVFLQFLLTGHYITEPVVKPLSTSLSSTKPSRGFCQICHETILPTLKSCDPDDPKFRYFMHHQTTESLKMSAEEGCRICATVWYKLTRLKPKRDRISTKYTTAYEILYHHRIRMTSKWTLHSVCEFDIFSSSDVVGDNLENHTGSESSLDTAKRWISTCLRDHPSCCAGSDTHFRPSRLLHIGGDDHQVTLHTSTDYPEALSYMTLSHRWGEAQFIQLRRSNEEAFRQGIPWSSLPQTFKDAIRVARHLGSDYLWIDSLCIVQDSKEDWTTEAASMGNIYKNSLSLEGCLYPRTPRALEPERLPWDFDSSGHSYIINADPKEPHELYSRAWVFQEFLLARRTVDCGRDQLFWRCDGLMASEEIPLGFPAKHANYAYPQFTHPGREVLTGHEGMKQWEAEHQQPVRTLGFSGDGQSLFPKDIKIGSPSRLWTSLVDRYSSMSITVEEDRLNAIAGVADVFRPFLGEYHAGMWQYMLPPYLLWSTMPHWRNNERPCKRPSSKRGPTWSWISIEGPISHHWCDFGPSNVLRSQLLDASVVSIQEIHLRIQGPLIRLEWVAYVRGKEALRPKPVNPGPSIRGSRGISKWRSSWLESFVQPDGDADAVINLSFDVAEEEATARDIALLVILESSGQIHGLIIQYKGGGFYSRVGNFYTEKCSSQPFLECDEMEIVLL